MSRTTKIILVVAVIAAVGLIVWRRHLAHVTDAGSYTPSHDIGALSTGYAGSTATSAPLTPYGSQVKTYTDTLSSLVSSGQMTTKQAAESYDAAVNSPQTRPGFVPSSVTTYVPPSTGPATETRSGRGHF